MNFIQADYFTTDFELAEFDGIITDIPWETSKNSLQKNLRFDYAGFMNKTSKETIEDAFLITFANFLACHDLMGNANAGNWHFKTYQIWNKRSANFINFHHPLRQVEFILYFAKNDYQFNFKDGFTSLCPHRKHVGLHSNDPKNKPEFSQGCYPEILTFPNPKNKINKFEKPVEFSRMFRRIVGDKNVLDPFCGTGNLLASFPRSTGIDITDYINYNESRVDGVSHLAINVKNE